MKKISVVEAKNSLTQLLQAVEGGERITICRHGKPIVDLVPTEAGAREERIFGAQRGVVVLDPDWAKPQNDIDAWLKGDV